MKKNELKKKIEELENKKHYAAIEAEYHRARSVNAGTNFGGTTEIIMRGHNGDYMWCPLQPVEVAELIHQLAANIGCNIVMQPRNDFSSWRVWNLTKEEREHMNGHPPFVNDMAPFNQLGIKGVDKENFYHLLETGFNGTNGGIGGVPEQIVRVDGQIGVVLAEDGTKPMHGMSPEQSALYKTLSDSDKVKFAHEYTVHCDQGLNKKEIQDEIVATKKPANKRTAKRATASS